MNPEQVVRAKLEELIEAAHATGPENETLLLRMLAEQLDAQARMIGHLIQWEQARG